MVIALVCVQLCLFQLQKSYGPRCFVPKALRPRPANVYEYRRKVPAEVHTQTMQQLEDADLEDSSQTTCTICLHSVYLGVDGSGNLSNESLQKLSMNCKQKCINMFKRE